MSRTPNLLSLLLLSLSAASLLNAGCGDGPICPSEISLSFLTPTDGSEISSADDINTNEPGTQQDIRVRSNLDAGSPVTLTITEESTGAVTTAEAVANSDGDIVFTGVTLPTGNATLLVEGQSECGSGSQEISLIHLSEGNCEVSIENGPLENDFFAPLPVLNASNDNDPNAEDFQATVQVTTSTGFDVELSVLDFASGTETLIGSERAGTEGSVSFDATLAQGRQSLRAICKRGSSITASMPNTVVVDTLVPTCSLTAPQEGVTVTPDHDEDGTANGIQMTWTGLVDDAGENDTEGEATSFFRDSTEFLGNDVSADGTTQTAGFAEFTAPGDFDLSFRTQDHAGNACVGGFQSKVIMDGCPIEITGPSAIVTADGNGLAGDGVQADFTVQVGDECAGQDVFVDCGHGESSAVAPNTGTAVVPNVTMSTDPQSEGTANCTARVIHPENYQTSDTASVPWDTQAPGTTLNILNPAGLSCGDTVAADNDADGNPGNGFQMDVRAVSPLAAAREFLVSNVGNCAAGCTTPESSPGGSTRITLDLGDNDVRAVARDTVGNQGDSGPCNIAVADIAVTFDDPVDSGIVGSVDGTVSGNNLEMTICGTVSLSDVSLTLSVDGAAGLATTVTGNNWCTSSPVSLSEGTHQLEADAQSNADARVGLATQNVEVDLTAPDMPTGFVAGSSDRQSVQASWDSVQGAASYMLRISESPFTDFANEGTAIDVGALTSGQAEQLTIDASYFVGVAAVDGAGNLSAAATLGPVIPSLDATASITPPNFEDGNSKGLGFDTVSADFDGDGFDDLAVSAYLTQVSGVDSAGAVQIYRGSASGISATPALTITGPATFAQFGWGLATINWGGGTQPGLAIGSPFSDNFNGEVYIFHDTTISAAFSGGSLAAASADIVLQGAPGSRFAGGFTGASLASGQVDANGTPDDLIVGVPGNGGGAMVIYGANGVSGTVTLDDNDAAGMQGLRARLFNNPESAANGALLGVFVEYLGDTRSGDGVGDFAMSYFSDDQSAIDDRIYIVRGRPAPAAAGVEVTALGPNDLTVLFPFTGFSAFGESIGTISDQSGDGFRDIVISAARRGTGNVYIVDGSLTGTTDLSSTFLAHIQGETGNLLFGSGIANNLEVAEPDLNGDGAEDLLIMGGRAGTGDDARLYVWLNSDIPSGNSTSASATTSILAPADFDAGASNGQKRAREVNWAGDVNNDGLTDICISDYFSESNIGGNQQQEGRVQVLWDQP